MSVADKLADNIDLLSVIVQTMSELGRAVENISLGRGDTDGTDISRLTDSLEELAFDRSGQISELSDLLKSLYNRKYDTGRDSLVARIQSKES